MTSIALISGLAIFLYAMHNLEAGIRLSSGDGLRKWLAGSTNSPISSAGAGVVVTAIMQSSSMVSLVALAFVSAGIMPLYNGIGVVLGANLGTTITGWVVTIVGFKMNLQALVVPLLGLGAAISLAYRNNSRGLGLGRAIFAFGLLIFGLDLMKESVSGLAEIFNLASLKDMPAWVYLITGITLAAVMQSSSAVMIVTLSMLHSGLIQLTDAAAIVIGADLGTTSTMVLGSIGQSVIKKQLAFAHVFFNVSVNSLVFLLFLPALPLFLQLLSVQDPMFGLVAFHTTFNLLGLLVFLPILRLYTRWIERLIPAHSDPRKAFFMVPVAVPDAALDSLVGSLQQLRSDAVNLHLLGLELSTEQLDLQQPLPAFNALGSDEHFFEQCYESLKEFEGDFIRYAGRLRQSNLSEQQDRQVNDMVESARCLVYASKTLKDVRADFSFMQQAVNNPLAVQLKQSHQAFLLDFFSRVLPLFSAPHSAQYLTEKVAESIEVNARHRQQANNLVTKFLEQDDEILQRLSTWFNLNHELHHYARCMIDSILQTEDLNR